MARPKERIYFSNSRFKQARKHTGETIKSISEALYIPIDTLKQASRYELIAPYMLEDIAAYMGVSCDYLTGGKTANYEEIYMKKLEEVRAEYENAPFEGSLEELEEVLQKYAENSANNFLYDDDGNIIPEFWEWEVKKEINEKEAALRECLKCFGKNGVFDLQKAERLYFSEVTKEELSWIRYELEKVIVKTIKGGGANGIH